MPALPIEPLRPAFLEALARGPVVVTSPTGSGKSTQVPRWCLARGSVLVIEPRRVAARSLAQRVAELERSRLGARVGYAVRAESRRSASTELLFVTPGVALRMLASGDHAAFDTVILDELHERTLDMDLLLALLQGRASRLVAMSATIEGDRVAAHLGGAHLQAQGRTYPVETRYLPGRTVLPDLKGLDGRVLEALAAAEELDGDVLVFMPGKGEIARTVDLLRGRTELEILPLHGGLRLEEQARVFSPGARRRVVVSTNVAETSLTIPRIGVVVDSGLVRRTRYHHGRGYLTLVPIAQDSADQRAGRAGRLGPGVCLRLWSERAPLAPLTPPEIYRESLVPLVLAAASCGAPELELPFLDPPKDYALADAREDLRLLGALTASHGLTERGRRLFGLPLDAHLGRLLVEAEATGALEDAVDLVAALSTPRALFLRGPRPEAEEDDLRAAGCDATALIAAMRRGEPRRHRLDAYALREARQTAARLREAFGLGALEDRPLRREILARTVLAAWPRAAHVARRRKRHVAWSHGGTEVRLGRDSCVDEAEVEYLAVLDSRALGRSRLDREVVITAAMPLRRSELLAAGLGRDRLAGAVVVDGVGVSRVERVYAGRVLATREEVPTGVLARETLATLILRGSALKGAAREIRDRLEAAALHARLERVKHRGPTPEAWTLARLEELGVESGEDLALLAVEDVLPPQLPEEVRQRLDRHFPRRLAIGDATYRIEYEPVHRVATLILVKGGRKSLPPVQLVPSLPGWTIKVRDGDRIRTLRRG